MVLDRDEIIQIIAKDFGILLTKDDPVLAVLAVHDVVLRYYTNEVNINIEQLKKNLEFISDRHQDHTKTLSESLIVKAVQQISEESQNFQKNLHLLLEKEHQRHQIVLEALTERSELANKQATIAMWVAVVFSLVSMVTIAVIL